MVLTCVSTAYPLNLFYDQRFPILAVVITVLNAYSGFALVAEGKLFD